MSESSGGFSRYQEIVYEQRQSAALLDGAGELITTYLTGQPAIKLEEAKQEVTADPDVRQTATDAGWAALALLEHFSVTDLPDKEDKIDRQRRAVAGIVNFHLTESLDSPDFVDAAIKELGGRRAMATVLSASSNQLDKLTPQERLAHYLNTSARGTVIRKTNQAEIRDHLRLSGAEFSEALGGLAINLRVSGIGHMLVSRPGGSPQQIERIDRDFTEDDAACVLRLAARCLPELGLSQAESGLITQALMRVPYQEEGGIARHGDIKLIQDILSHPRAAARIYEALPDGARTYLLQLMFELSGSPDTFEVLKSNVPQPLTAITHKGRKVPGGVTITDLEPLGTTETERLLRDKEIHRAMIEAATDDPDSGLSKL